MAGLTLDAGALVAADKDDRIFWAYFKESIDRGVVPVIPAAVLAQAWRGARQARLAKLVKVCWVEPLDESLAKSAGELCAAAKTSDIVDASVIASAATRGDIVLTSDPKDLRRLASIASTVDVIKL